MADMTEERSHEDICRGYYQLGELEIQVVRHRQSFRNRERTAPVHTCLNS